jgi:hypothetical protein
MATEPTLDAKGFYDWLEADPSRQHLPQETMNVARSAWLAAHSSAFTQGVEMMREAAVQIATEHENARMGDAAKARDHGRRYEEMAWEYAADEARHIRAAIRALPAPDSANVPAVDEIDITGWGAWKSHAIPMHVARHIAAKVNERFAASPLPPSQEPGHGG